MKKINVADMLGGITPMEKCMQNALEMMTKDSIEKDKKLKMAIEMLNSLAKNRCLSDDTQNDIYDLLEKIEK